MNCRRFEQRLYEYVEGTLSARSQAAGDRHLAACAACREALRRHRQIGQALSSGLEQAAQSLRLRPEVEQRVLRAWQSQCSVIPARQEQPLVWLLRRSLWPWLAAASVLVAGVLLVARLARRQPAGSETARHRGSGFPGYVSIQVSYPVPAYEFRRQGSLVIDALVYQTNRVEGKFRPEGGRNFM